MLYLVLVDKTMRWCDLPGKVAIEAARDRGVDLSKLDWLKADRLADEDTVRLALRYGVACSTGIAVDAVDLAAQGRPAAIRTAHRNAQKAHDAIPKQHDELMEHLIPGWTQHGRELGARVAESSEEAAREAEEELAEDLEADPDNGLVQHWVALGGRLPEPV